MNIKNIAGSKTGLSILFIVFLVVPRVVLFTIENVPVSRDLWPDEKGYSLIAENMVRHHRYSNSAAPPFEPTGYRGPVYPLFLAVVSLVSFTGHPGIVYGFQALLFIPFFIIMLKVYRRLDHLPNSGDTLSRLILLLLCSLYPAMVFYSVRIMPDILFTFIICAFVLVQIQSFDTGQFSSTFIAGLILGVSMLCKPASLLLPFFMMPLYFLNYQKRVVAHLLLFLFGIILVLTPWMVRNKLVLDTFKPVLQGGQNLYSSAMNRISDIPLKEGKYVTIIDTKVMGRLRENKTEAQADAIYLRKALILIARHPFVYLKFSLIKGYTFWKQPIGLVLLKQKSFVLAGVFLTGYLVFLLFGFYGLILLARRRSAITVLPLTVVIYFTVFHSLTHSLPRYHLPCIPFLFLGMVYVFRRLIDRR